MDPDRSATLPAALAQLAWEGTRARPEGAELDQSRELERFLAGVERRAFRIAQVALRDADDALDAVQDAMIQLARRYAARPSDEWRPLFYRILQNKVRDLQRRRKVRRAVLGWLPAPARFNEDEAPDPIEQVADVSANPFDELAGGEAMAALEQALAALPGRQREAFMLRNFEGLDVAGTAIAMGCSEGSVKTHYFRAVHALREALVEHEP